MKCAQHPDLSNVKACILCSEGMILKPGCASESPRKAAGPGAPPPIQMFSDCEMSYMPTCLPPTEVMDKLAVKFK